VRTEKLSADEIRSGNFRILTQTHGPGHIAVVWKSLSIRAEKLNGLAIEDQDMFVAELDRERASLPAVFAHDFTRDPLIPARWRPWVVAAPSQPNPSGLLVSGPPTDHWTSAGVERELSLRGDFDIAFEFHLLTMTAPKTGLNSSIYLQIETLDAPQHQYNVIFGGALEGGKYILAQFRGKAPDGSLTYNPLSRATVNQVQRLRLARRGQQLYFLFAEDVKKPDQLLTQYELPAAGVPVNFLRLMIHTGGAGNVTEALWKNVIVKAK
jgi:hypothetical protein